MNSKVGEIFTSAGQAFSRLGDLTMQLQTSGDAPSDKWTEEEMDMLHASIIRFSDDLEKISLSIKNRTVSQIRQALKKKAFEEAGIPAKQVPVQQVQHVIQTVQQQHHLIKQQQQSTIIAATPVVATTTPSQQQQQQHQAVHIQHVQHLIPVQQSLQSAVGNQTAQIIQTAPKQIIIQQAAPPAVQGGGGSVSAQLTQPQIVHLQPQQLQQLQQAHAHVQVQPHHQQIIQPAQNNTTTTTITLAQFQQMQAQKALLAAAASSSSSSSTTNAVRVNTTAPNTTSTVVATPNISDNMVVQQQQQQQPPTVAAVTSVSNASNLVTVNNINTVSAVTINNSKSGAMVATSAAGNTNAGTIATLKSGPDVTMTLNRINTQENEVDVEECLPVEVVKMDFSSEEVAG